MTSPTNLAPLSDLYRLNTRLVLNCLDGLSDVDATRRLTPATNNIAFLAVHLTDVRYFLAKLLGRKLENPLAERFGEVKSIEEVTSFPSVEELRGLWTGISTQLMECLKKARPEMLKAKAPHRFPVSDSSVLGAVAFLAQRESYHLGQIAFLRKAVGQPAMAYP
jgi:hypothetical protein